MVGLSFGCPDAGIDGCNARPLLFIGQARIRTKQQSLSEQVVRHGRRAQVTKKRERANDRNES